VLSKWGKNEGSNSVSAWLVSFSLSRCWDSLASSRCKLWDNRELDLIEGFKFFCFFLAQLCLTAQFLMCTQTINPWTIEKFFQEVAFTIVISSNLMCEAFVAFSGFFGAYRLFLLYDANGSFSFKEYAKYVGRKYFRLAPAFYVLFFVSWAVFPRLGAGPIWYQASYMFQDCDKYWWSQLLFIGNIYPYFSAPNAGCFFWSWII